jgi:hypothetical protein
LDGEAEKNGIMPSSSDDEKSLRYHAEMETLREIQPWFDERRREMARLRATIVAIALCLGVLVATSVVTFYSTLGAKIEQQTQALKKDIEEQKVRTSPVPTSMASDVQRLQTYTEEMLKTLEQAGLMNQQKSEWKIDGKAASRLKALLESENTRSQTDADSN